MIRFELNGAAQECDLDPATPLLWVLRDHLALTGTKFGCGAGQCGACTVHIDGQARRSCQTPLAQLAGKRVTTIEAMQSVRVGRALQAAWLVHDVPQCGYCQSGQIMSAAVLLMQQAQPDDAAIDTAMQGNLCRCGTYLRVRAAIKSAARQLRRALPES